jgi:hypothetical protein
MNIFAIDKNPYISARHLVDKHVNKMITESAQILSNCFKLEDMSRDDCPRTQNNTPRKYSYPHHPCCIWAKQSKQNMIWLIEHSYGLNQERKERFNKNADHFSIDFIKWCHINIEKSIAPSVPMTSFAQAMPDEYKSSCAHCAYKNYYQHGKKHLHKWTRNKPKWIT